MKERTKSRWMLIVSMCIFGTIGIVRKYIPLPSSFVALARAVIGTLFLLAVVLLRSRRVSITSVRKNLLPLVLSGAALGFNWIFLFESYNHTTVATATLCYYLAPILVILASPLVLKEKITPLKILCAGVALIGMVLVSGVAGSRTGRLSDGKGIICGLSAAVLYACVMLLNRKITGMDAYSKTIIQLGISSVILLPYVLVTENIGQFTFSPVCIALLAVAGIVHTGIAYWLYFGAVGQLPAQTSALLSYIDPIIAILLSVTLLHEPMSVGAAVGAVMILGAAIISERAG